MYQLLLNKVKVARLKPGIPKGIDSVRRVNLDKVIRKNLLGSFMVKGVGIVVNLAIIPLGINMLDKERFGIWVIINSLLAWLTFFDLGLGNGLRNQLTHAFQKKRIAEARRLIGTGYTSILCAISIALLVFLSINNLIHWSSVFNVSERLNAELTKVIFWSVCLFLLQVFFKNIGFILLSLQMTAINNSLSVIANILSLAAIFLIQLFRLPSSLLTYALVICGAPVLVYFIITIVFFTGRLSFLRPSSFRIDRGSLKSIGGLGIKFFVIQVTAMVLFQGNNIFITQYFGPTEVTSYNVSYRYFNIVIMVFSILLTPFWSAFTKAYASGDMQWIRNTLIKLKRLWFGSVAAVIIMFLLAGRVYHFWIGDKVQVSIAMNVANGLFAVIYAWNSIYLYFLNGTGKVRLQYYLTLIVLALYIPLTILLLHVYANPSVIIYTNCLIQLLFSVFCYLQVHKILNKKDYGIWNQ